MSDQLRLQLAVGKGHTSQVRLKDTKLSSVQFYFWSLSCTSLDYREIGFISASMSFGFGVGDFLTAIDLAKCIRARFVDAPVQFAAISAE